MSVTDDDITPDRLRRTGWDDDWADIFTHEGAASVKVWFCDRCHGWHWRSRDDDREWLTGMADVAARLAAAGGGGP